MLYKRTFLEALHDVLDKKAEEHFNINTQYKFLKIKKKVEEELEIYYAQIRSLSDYFEKDSNDQPIISEDGGVKIKGEYKEKLLSKIAEINQQEVMFPDIYFSIEELEPLDFTLAELELIEPFIKD